MRTAIGPVMLGRAVAFRGEERSAIGKAPASAPVMAGPLGLAGDEQADLTVHGGTDKAIHHYPHDHYAAWAAELNGHPLLAAPGAFGENITTTGLTEDQVCIGDRFRLGHALVEVSQGRQPCWKIDHRFERKGVTARVIETGRCGWYYRVIEPGAVAAGDTLALADRPHAEWTVARTFRLLIGGGHKAEPQAVAELAALPALAESWQARAHKLAAL
jgi:MOSC domain-containing protein YiiM